MSEIRDKNGRFAGGLSDEKKVEVINRYKLEKISGAALAKEYNVSSCYITSLLRKSGIKLERYTLLKRRYPFNENYFEVIDSEEKAYFLGFLYADGCNYTEKGSILVSLQERDRHILEEFKKLVGCSISLKLQKLSLKNKNWQNKITLELYSKKNKRRC